MMNRKGSVFALTALAAGLGLSGIAWAASRDDDSPLKKAMEQVQAKDAFIKKNYKTKAVFTKNQKEMVESAKALAKLGKEFRLEAGPVKEQKKTQKEWTDLMDAYVKEVESYATEIAKPGTTVEVAKDKYKPVIASCTACHTVFRKDD